MPATGWTTSSSRSSVSPPPPPPPPPRRVARGACGHGTGDRADRRGRRRHRRRCCCRCCCWLLLRVLVALLVGIVAAVVGCRRWSRFLSCRSCWLSLLVRWPSLARPGRRPAWAVCSPLRAGARLAGGAAALTSLLGRARRRRQAVARVGVGRVAVSAACRCRRPALAGAAVVGRRRAAVGLASALADRGDQLALAHTGGALDADLVGQGAQLGQHHGRQRTTSATSAGAAGAQRPPWARPPRRASRWSRQASREMSFCGHGARQLALFGAVASRDEVRISHGFPFFPSLITSRGGSLHSARFAELRSCHRRICNGDRRDSRR